MFSLLSLVTQPRSFSYHHVYGVQAAEEPSAYNELKGRWLVDRTVELLVDKLTSIKVQVKEKSQSWLKEVAQRQKYSRNRMDWHTNKDSGLESTVMDI